MKHLLILCLAIGCLVGCKKDDGDPGPSTNNEEEYLEKLIGGWELDKATVDGDNVTDEFPGLILYIAENEAYVVVRGPEHIWPPSGTFEMKKQTGSSNYTLVRDADDVEMEVKELTATKLVIEFDYVFPGGRTTSVDGRYRFEFTKIE